MKTNSYFINKNIFFRLRYFYNNDVSNFDLKFYHIYSRNSIIHYTLLNKTVLVYNGKLWIKVKVNKYKLGHKFGEFTWNRKFLSKKNKLKKKK